MTDAKTGPVTAEEIAAVLRKHERLPEVHSEECLRAQVSGAIAALVAERHAGLVAEVEAMRDACLLVPERLARLSHPTAPTTIDEVMASEWAAAVRQGPSAAGVLVAEIERLRADRDRAVGAVEELRAARVEEEIETTCCGKCGAPSGDYEKRGGYDRDEARLELDSGTVYPEGGTIDRVIFDCCVRCFKEHVIPALVALGFTPREYEIDI